MDIHLDVPRASESSMVAANAWAASEFRLAYHIPAESQPACLNPTADDRHSRSSAGGPSAAEQIGRDLLAGIDQALHGRDRFIESFAVLAGELDLDNAFDPLRADHDRHADIHVSHTIFAV